MRVSQSKGLASRAFQAIRSVLTVTILAAATFGGLWTIWRLWSWAMPRAVPYLPSWFTTPDFVWFLTAWLMGNIAVIAVLWRKGSRRGEPHT